MCMCVYVCLCNQTYIFGVAEFCVFVCVCFVGAGAVLCKNKDMCVEVGTCAEGDMFHWRDNYVGLLTSNCVSQR